MTDDSERSCDDSSVHVIDQIINELMNIKCFVPVTSRFGKCCSFLWLAALESAVAPTHMPVGRSLIKNSNKIGGACK